LYLLGFIIFGKISPIQYLTHSISHFLGKEELKEKLENIGFKNIKIFSLTGGIVCIHAGVKY
jgi:ubiquinone/menaquinone biosynthesis C-methylase UbiE